jgi:hypothetical protein
MATVFLNEFTPPALEFLKVYGRAGLDDFLVLGTPQAPVIANVSPSQAVAIASSQPLSFDVTDDSGAFRRLLVALDFPALGVYELAHDGDGFAAKYVAQSFRQSISGGYRFTLLRQGGWPVGPTIRIFAIDPSGAEA